MSGSGFCGSQSYQAMLAEKDSGKENIRTFSLGPCGQPQVCHDEYH